MPERMPDSHEAVDQREEYAEKEKDVRNAHDDTVVKAGRSVWEKVVKDFDECRNECAQIGEYDAQKEYVPWFAVQPT